MSALLLAERLLEAGRESAVTVRRAGALEAWPAEKSCRKMRATLG